MTEFDERSALAERIEEHGIRLQATLLGVYEDRDRPKWAGDMTGWRVTLRYDGRQMTLTFWMGIAHGETPPTAEDVLECLLSDASMAENATGAHDFAESMGYELSGRQEEQAFLPLVLQTERLKRLLGDAYEVFCWGEETVSTEEGNS